MNKAIILAVSTLLAQPTKAEDPAMYEALAIMHIAMDCSTLNAPSAEKIGNAVLTVSAKFRQEEPATTLRYFQELNQSPEGQKLFVEIDHLDATALSNLGTEGFVKNVCESFLVKKTVDFIKYMGVQS